MSTRAQGRFAGLAPPVRQRIAEFHRYIVAQHHARDKKWPGARKLIQGISSEIAATQAGRLPIKLAPIARELAVTVRPVGENALARDGQLEPRVGGFEATVVGLSPSGGPRQSQFPLWQDGMYAEEGVWEDADLSRRGRFTLAHELGHVFFYTSSEGQLVPERLIPPPRQRSSSSWREEGLCHDFARALLIPQHWRSLVTEQPSMQNLVTATGIFAVATEPMIRRILYDWRMWSSSIFAYVSVGPDRVKVEVFKGQDRRKRTQYSITRTEIRRQISGAKSVVEAGGLLRDRYSLPEDSLLIARSTLWAEL